MSASPSAAGAMFGRLAAALEQDWSARARPKQLAPPGEWSTWLILAGRGWGKTRTGAEWVCAQVRSGRARRLALVAATAADCRDVMIEGPSGILAVSPDWDRPDYEPSKRRITWKNGAVATLFSAEEGDRLRGPQHDLAWCDEVGVWPYPDEVWNMLQLGLRVGRNPRCLVTTTPKPIRLIRELLSRDGRGVVVTAGSTYENRDNLAPQFLEQIAARYAGTRLARQEIEAEVLDDAPGSLWQRSWFDRDRVAHAPALRRIVVAIDPAVTSGEDADETGILVCGVGADGHAYVLADLSGRFPPHEWAAIAIRAYHHYRADRLIAETNNGGEMVAGTIRVIDPSVSFRAVTASRGKVMRAEPVAALYEQRKVHHVGGFPRLEDQACLFTSDFSRSSAGYSPDRLDALVWALTELCLGRSGNPAFCMPIIFSNGVQVSGAGAQRIQGEYANYED